MRQAIEAVFLAVGLMIATAASGIAGNWYEGGTLSNATLDEWAAAEPANRLATAAYWTIGYIGADTALKLADQDLRTLSKEVAICIDQVAEDPTLDLKAADAATGCMILMKYPAK